MARRKKEAAVSPLPEKFEVFAKSMTAQEPEPAALKARPIGGMVEKAWSGKRLWECPRCKATTFSEPESKVHSCKEVRFADEELAD